MMTDTTLSTPKEAAAPKAWRYFQRSLRLRCPVCGRSPLFRPIGDIRAVSHWFETLEGCPHCNYVYDREPGYFMAALLMFDYGLAALFGMALLLVLYFKFQLTTLPLLLWTLIPTFIFALLMVRHAKAFWLALDHYFFHQD